MAMTFGIVGLGRIGAAVARLAKGFNMKITYGFILCMLMV